MSAARTLDLHHYPDCGCTKHWKPVRKEAAPSAWRSTRLMDPAAIADICVRHCNGAGTFKYLA